ncbi:MAG: tRNA (guanosine(46)-N7)-methyltransferase TrmB [Deltaproteobacteria bacterium]|nr:tRNA (guanosine(46)-N7)-methyltransferase TrmB [Deltaproteobacteria bacterium]
MSTRRPLSLAEKKERDRKMPLVLPGLMPGPIRWDSIFERDQPLEFEVGFGRPHFLLERALERPDRNVVGVDWKAEWARQTHRRARRKGLKNVLGLYGNAWFMAGSLFQPESLTTVFLNFPDPWWKAKHEKRRVINDAFAGLLTSRLKVGGQFQIQTDVASLLEEELEHLEARADLRNIHGKGRLAAHKPTRARTHREKKCVLKGIPVFRAVLERC